MIRQFIERHTHLDSSKQAWENSWNEQVHGEAGIILLGRKVYNHFLTWLLKKYIDQETDFLEFGCGAATCGVLLARDVKSYTGFDIAENALDEARKNLEKAGVTNYHFELKDITNFESDKKFGVVWSHGLIEHFTRPAELIDNHLKVCQTGGYVVISVPVKHSYHHLWYFLTRFKPLRKFWPWPDQIWISRKNFRQYMTLLKNSYTSYKIIRPWPWVLGLVVLVIKR